ncbi:PAS domain-containing protein [Bradyrhizobium sp. CCGUVB14]|uniref:PAS domain-containing protein n=1 Tax=Bradyrhizobium sp. CCGUVB14 TaxID=2949628 RepID=UPI0020B21364|nr:PAS domain-containing protein [Bradyrhizobium sp. CCGUVB14]MCP3441627.1 PAS domain-containing protein [Bradyrhizobium sp. CCGUVB14]
MINDEMASAQPGVIPSNYFRFLERQLKIGVCRVDLQSGQMTWTEGMYDLFDQDRTVSPSRAALLERMHPTDRGNRAPVNAALKNRISFEDSFRVILRDRRIRWVRAYGEFLFSERGSPDGLIVLMADVTLQRAQQNLLYIRTQHLHAVARLARATVTTAAADGRVTDVVHLQPFAGDAKPLGTNWMDWIHPDDRATIMQAHQKALGGREEVEVEARVRLADGSSGWRRLRAAPIRSASGRFLEWLGLSFDIDGERTGRTLLDPGRPVTGAQLRAARGLLKISVQKLSELADISIAVIRRLEELDGVSRDGAESARRLRDALERRGAVFIFPSDMKPTATLR